MKREAGKLIAIQGGYGFKRGNALGLKRLKQV